MTEEKKVAESVNPVVLNNIVIGLDAVPTYNGLSSIDEFLAVIEETAVLANWTEIQKVAIARLKLREQAKQYIEAEETLKTTPCWNTLSRALRKQFKRPEINGESRRKYMDCKQRHGETCRQFLTRLKVLANKTISYTGTRVIDDVLKNRFEEELTTLFVMGLLMPLKAKILSKAPTTLNSALEIAEREEAIESIIRPSVSHRECRGLILNKSQEQTYNDFKKEIRCYNCQKQGHIAKDCRQTKSLEMRCYKCKKIGHFANVCRTIPERRSCFDCNKVGHLQRNCPNNQQRVPNNRNSLNANAATFRPRSQAAQQPGSRQ